MQSRPPLHELLHEHTENQSFFKVTPGKPAFRMQSVECEMLTGWQRWLSENEKIFLKSGKWQLLTLVEMVVGEIGGK